jgi:hypothetical protein
VRPSLWFVVPVHGRLNLTKICLGQLRHTISELRDHGVDAHAVVISDATTLRQLHLLTPASDFSVVQRNNFFLSRKFNDGIQLACDPRYNPRPADYVVPCGSDDWVDWRIFLDLPREDTMVGFQQISFVREDGREMVTKVLNYPGGSGIRIYPRQLFEAVGFRPGDEDRPRACDTSILLNTQAANRTMRIEHREVDARAIVDWKSSESQLNPYDRLARFRSQSICDPFEALQGFYPADSLSAMETHYGLVRRFATA